MVQGAVSPSHLTGVDVDGWVAGLMDPFWFFGKPRERFFSGEAVSIISTLSIIST